MKTILVACILAPLALLAQTIQLPALSLSPNPAVPGGFLIPATAIPITPAPVAPVPAVVPTPRNTFQAIVNNGLIIASVEYKAGTHVFTTYNGGALGSYTLQLQPYQFINYRSYSVRPKFSIVTVPFKIRPALRDTIPAKAIADLKNIGIVTNLLSMKLDRYFWDGTKTTHRWAIGILLAPSVEEVGPATSDNRVLKATNQMFLSAGLSITYSYGDVSFVAIAPGMDFGLTRIAQKSIYNQKLWFGFGVGISSKFLGF